MWGETKRRNSWSDSNQDHGHMSQTAFAHFLGLNWVFKGEDKWRQLGSFCTCFQRRTFWLSQCDIFFISLVSFERMFACQKKVAMLDLQLADFFFFFLLIVMSEWLEMKAGTFVSFHNVRLYWKEFHKPFHFTDFNSPSTLNFTLILMPICK